MDSEQAGPPASYNMPSSGGGRSIITTVVLLALLMLAIVFGGWAFSQRQHYKNNSSQITAAAVAKAETSARQDQQVKDDQANKSPYKTYQGSPTYGSITFSYPKTWSAYIDTTSASEPINGYFYPDVVPGIQGKTAFALRIELLSTDYSQIMQQFQSQISQGQLTAKAYIPPKMQGVANVSAGTYLSGQINNSDQTQRGNMLAIKVRDKTLEIYSESADFAADFNNTILASLSFVP